MFVYHCNFNRMLDRAMIGSLSGIESQWAGNAAPSLPDRL